MFLLVAKSIGFLLLESKHQSNAGEQEGVFPPLNDCMVGEVKCVYPLVFSSRDWFDCHLVLATLRGVTFNGKPSI